MPGDRNACLVLRSSHDAAARIAGYHAAAKVLSINAAARIASKDPDVGRTGHRRVVDFAAAHAKVQKDRSKPRVHEPLRDAALLQLLLGNLARLARQLRPR